MLYSFVKGKVPSNPKNIQSNIKVGRKKKGNKRSRTIKKICYDNMFTPNTEKERSTELISATVENTFELENVNIGWTLVTTKYRKSYSDC